ncbi:MAG TPA: DsrE/DsrF/DrsH-like family protein, partial [Tepiditoga sp.]|nr:DsrE/DsrF/DrsH-like family protein [Tepiditoga sp.]
ILATGVKPETELALKAGIEVGRGGIKVNEYLQTSDKYIYAVGDAVEVYNPLLGADTLIPLASPANRQGRIAATNIIRDNCDKYEGAFGTSIIKFFDMTAASAGLNEKRLNSMGIKYFKSITHGNSNAGYYPGAMPLTIKLLFSEDGKILGGQVIGFKGVDKRIDVISTSIKAGLRVEDLETLELAYAPPFGSAKDPVNIAGYVANNILKKDVEVINIEDLKTDDDNYCILDIRTDEEQSLGKIESEYSLHIPLNDLRNRLDEIPKNKVIVTYCQVGLRGYLAYRILKNKGFNVKNLNGGFKLYTYYNQKISVKENKKESQKIDFKVQDKNVLRLDACGLQCPGPIMETYKKMNNMQNGEVIEIKATDPGFKKDIVKWAEKTGNKVLDVNSENGVITAKLIKGEPVVKGNTDNQNDNKTIVVFSNDLDRALASFVIANGAAAMGKKVTMFFTFWGLNILRKENFKVSGKTFVEKMFGNMMPQGPGKLKLSKLNMAGMGTSMMKKVMKQKNIDSLEKMINSALENGITLMACQMSMDMMGIKKEELIDKVEVGGVASYLAETEESNLNLFI